VLLTAEERAARVVDHAYSLGRRGL
jgi:hypothetical protein